MPAWTRIYLVEDLKLKSPILVQGLPGLGLVGKLAVNYLIDELKPKLFAELYSSYLNLPDGSTGIQIKEDGTYYMPKIELYVHRHPKHDIILITGDSQPTLHGQYEVVDHILELAQKQGCERVIALGGFQTPVEKEIGKVYGVFNDAKLGEDLKNLGVQITRSGAITGACGVILGLSDRRSIPSIALLGATRGDYPDMQAARGVLNVLLKILDISISFERMDKEIEDIKVKLEELRRIQAETYPQLKKELGKRPFYV
ncbi:PAC2 family protein [Candidatus Hecatella orcuttiae]|jgi:hypothetical protein|uniref:PAC2 family protein n=1 Tax=Candidatus Hecatella orcuttiae TaxID=1935119 RepID=UPI0028680837|nr:PAC2 family protein [Candidatus Hecatella orcuttiae]